MTPNELYGALGRLAAPDTDFDGYPDYHGGLNGALTALTALGLEWTRYYDDGWKIAVGPKGLEPGDRSGGITPEDDTPAALAAAWVRAVLAMVKEAVRDDE